MVFMNCGSASVESKLGAQSFPQHVQIPDRRSPAIQESSARIPSRRCSPRTTAEGQAKRGPAGGNAQVVDKLGVKILDRSRGVRFHRHASPRGSCGIRRARRLHAPAGLSRAGERQEVAPTSQRPKPSMVPSTGGDRARSSEAGRGSLFRTAMPSRDPRESGLLSQLVQRHRAKAPGADGNGKHGGCSCLPGDAVSRKSIEDGNAGAAARLPSTECPTGPVFGGASCPPFCACSWRPSRRKCHRESACERYSSRPWRRKLHRACRSMCGSPPFGSRPRPVSQALKPG